MYQIFQINFRNKNIVMLKYLFLKVAQIGLDVVFYKAIIQNK